MMSDHTTRAHARFGASSAHRWFACPGSVALTAGMPDEPSAAALEGTRAHELLEALLCLQVATTVGDVEEAERRRNIATWKWERAPQDMRDAVHVVVDHVKELVEDHPDAVVLVEHRFEVPVAAAPGEVFGTCDVVVFLPSLRTLHVVDYKHGEGCWVDVRGNKQLRFYGLGALTLVGPARHDAYGIDTVVLTVIQPRHWRWDGRPREEWLPVEEVLEFGKEIGEAIVRAKDANAALVPGEDQCQWCPARHGRCPAREALAASAFDGVTDVALFEPRRVPAAPEMTGARLAEVLGVADAIRAYLRDLEDEAERRLRAGGDVPGWKLVEAQARRQWVDGDPRAVALQLEKLSISDEPHRGVVMFDFLVEKLRGLGEVEAILKAGCDRKEARRRLDAMAYLTTKKSSGALKVARADDPRPAAVLGSAFDGVVHVEDKRNA